MISGTTPLSLGISLLFIEYHPLSRYLSFASLSCDISTQSLSKLFMHAERERQPGCGSDHFDLHFVFEIQKQMYHYLT